MSLWEPSRTGRRWKEGLLLLTSWWYLSWLLLGWELEMLLLFIKASLKIPHVLPPGSAPAKWFAIQNGCNGIPLLLACRCFISKFNQFESKFILVTSLTYHSQKSFCLPWYWSCVIESCPWRGYTLWTEHRGEKRGFASWSEFWSFPFYRRLISLCFICKLDNELLDKPGNFSQYVWIILKECTYLLSFCPCEEFLSCE